MCEQRVREEDGLKGDRKNRYGEEMLKEERRGKEEERREVGRVKESKGE